LKANRVSGDDEHHDAARDLGLISPTYHLQLLRAQIPKAQKNTVKPTVFFALLGFARVKASNQMLVKLTPGP